MASITPTELSVEELPVDRDLSSGTATFRRARVYIKASVTTAGDTLDLNTYLDDGVNNVEGVHYLTDDGAAGVGGSATWSTSTLTVNATGYIEMCVLVNFKPGGLH